MADISMCRNGNCPLRFNCHRYTANATDRQSYADFRPIRDRNLFGEVDVYCDYYINNEIGRTE